MIDLKEAACSLDTYAASLDLLCKQGELAISLGEVEKNTPDVQPRMAGVIDKVKQELRRVNREAQILSILISENVAKERKLLLNFPFELAELLEAQNQIVSTFQRSHDLLNLLEGKQAEKDAPRKESESGKAIREFLEKHEQEQKLERAKRKSGLES